MRGGAKFRHLWLFQFFADFCAIVSAYYLTYMLRFHSGVGERIFNFLYSIVGVEKSSRFGGELSGFYIESGPRIVIILTMVICLFYALLGLYPGRRFLKRRPDGWNIVLANFGALVLFFGYFYLSRNEFHPRSYFITLLFINVLICSGLRLGARKFIEYLRWRFQFDQYSAVLVGHSKEADYINDIIEVLHPHGLEVAGRVTHDRKAEFDVLLSSIEESVTAKKADTLIVADKTLTIEQIMSLLELSDSLGLSVKILSDKMDVLRSQAGLATDVIRGVSLVHFEAPSDRNQTGPLTLALSKFAAVLMFILVSPILLISALMIKLTSAGPLFFIQERMGVNRKPFDMFKFRTMYDRADEAQAQLEEFNESGEGLFKIKDDPRITPVGKFLRRFSLDELPQLLNVIKGDMNIVGPRPLPKRDFENYYEEWHYSRHAGMPGLTCLWQISGRSDIDFHNMCILDVYYLRNHSWVLDLKIFIKTFWVVLFGRGAY